MTSLSFTIDDIPDLTGKRVIITGGSSGIGRAAAIIFARKGAWVLNLDTKPPQDSGSHNVEYRNCNVTRWEDLKSAFAYAGNVDIAVANAGIAEGSDYLDDAFGAPPADLQEPDYELLDVNLRAVFNVTKLALASFRQRECLGSIVITASATAYAPEQCLPVYSATKLALIGFVRALRSAVAREGITVNAVAPAATLTDSLPANLAAPILAAGLPISSAEFVGLALVYSAVATQPGMVELYGKDADELKTKQSRWNGRTILTLGETYTELEGPIADLRSQWMGEDNAALTRLQQASTDARMHTSVGLL
ncbi:short chain dehydrogenase reductase family [Cordyceps militaris]|uniref:Short chain dehydrogenase reductase family n=1 Tax=Cordyceps militaris TaxID=73501 RepID=A0A2H4SDA9_CORMI|nr:short chain dehydrogenase reductase family [Cordyceps militaris]